MVSNFQMYLYAVPSAARDRQFSEDARCTLKVYKNSELIDTKDYITIQSFVPSRTMAGLTMPMLSVS